MKKHFVLVLGLLAGLAGGHRAAAEAPASMLARADAALQAGEADKALTLLQRFPNAGNDARAQNLTCRLQFTLAHWDDAIRACEQAIRLDPRNSDSHMWLGRAYGEKADRSSFMTAFSLGKRVLVEFQTATQLDPRNGEALSDLGEFYSEAPGVVGGGLDKAESVALQLDRVDAVRAAELRAGIAGQRSDYGTAESYLKQALTVSSHPAHQWASLARFYAARHRWDDMEAAVRSCETAAAHDPHAAVALYDGAGVLIKAKRDPQLAAHLLQEYLARPDKTQEAPAFIAYARLARLQEQLGDAANAQVALAAATELASQYEPARDLRR